MPRKLADVSRRLGEASKVLEAEQNGILAGVRLLWLAFKDWVFQEKKSELTLGMVPGCDVLTIDRVTLHLKEMEAARKLEVTGNEPAGIIAGCERLLDDVEWYVAAGFFLPRDWIALPILPHGRGGRHYGG